MFVNVKVLMNFYFITYSQTYEHRHNIKIYNRDELRSSLRRCARLLHNTFNESVIIASSLIFIPINMNEATCKIRVM